MREAGGAGYVGGDQINQSGPYATGKVVFHGGRPGPAPRHEPPARSTVLVLLSNPIDTPRLRLDEEFRAIRQAVNEARHRDQIDLKVDMALRHRDLQTLLRDHRPAVVHYAGHSGGSGIALLDPIGRAQPVPPRALEDLFAIVKEFVRCVVLNACLTDVQASAIAKHVPCVVGLSNSVLDPVAIEFAAGFHGALASGESIARAFEFGRNLPALAGLNNEGPLLFSANGVAERLTITG